MTETKDRSALEVRALTLEYGERRALDSVDLTVREGEVFGVLGPNGGGKSTLFRVASTLLPPTSGTVRVFGSDVAREASAVRAKIGVVFQMPSLDAKLRVRENLEIHGRLHGMDPGALRARCDALLEDFGLTARANDRVDTLSGGLARRVEVAKGMLPGPALLFLDEPSTGLDPGARHELRDLLLDLRENEGTTIVWTTHLLDEAEACDRIAILDRGKLIAEGAPRALKAELPGAVVLAEFRDPAAARARLREELDTEVQLVSGKLRLVAEDLGAAHELASRLTTRSHGGEDELLAVTVGRASLEDVFLARTGRSLREDTAEPATAGAGRKSGRKGGRGHG